MGDRGNIVVRDSDGKDVVFYSHWGGHGLAAVVRRAIGKEWRWTDDSYLARIIFCELVRGSEEDETGFGIARHLAGDREHAVVLVDIGKQTVSFVEDFEVDEPSSDDGGRFTRSFEDFAKMTDEEATELFESSEGGGDEKDDGEEDKPAEDDAELDALLEKLKAENAALKAENTSLKKKRGKDAR
jgi:hypothetical protein